MNWREKRAATQAKRDAEEEALLKLFTKAANGSLLDVARWHLAMGTTTGSPFYYDAASACALVYLAEQQEHFDSKLKGWSE